MSLIDIVQQSLGQADVQKISQEIGTDPATARTAIQNALPLLVGGMAGTAQQPSGAAGIESLLGSSGLGGGILGSILGRHQDDVHQGVQQSTGLNSDSTRKLLMMLAPIVLAAIARHRSQTASAPAQDGSDSTGSTGSGGLGDILSRAAQSASQDASSPHVGGILGKILAHVQAPTA